MPLLEINEYVQPVDGSSWIFLISQWPGLHFFGPTLPFIETFLILILTLFYIIPNSCEIGKLARALTSQSKS